MCQKMKKLINLINILLIFLTFLWAIQPIPAWTMDCFTMENGKTAYGKILRIKTTPNDTLLDIARRYDLGYNQIIGANPGLDPWTPGTGTEVLAPKLFILPDSRPSAGIVVNLAEMRLYYFRITDNGKTKFYTCPVGVGREGYATRLGIYMVRSKAIDPTWVVPPSVRKESPDLPEKIPPGAGNPLGRYILRFSRLQYGIHGTNRPWGVGRRVSHGCIRLYPEDIAQLFPLVSIGTLIQISYEPIKVGWDNNKCYLQVFRDYEGRIDDPFARALLAVNQCEKAIGPLKIDLRKIKKALKEQNGIPVTVATGTREE